MKQFATPLILQLFLVLILSMVPKAHALPQAIEPWVKETGKLVLVKDGKSEMPIVSEGSVLASCLFDLFTVCQRGQFLLPAFSICLLIFRTSARLPASAQ